MVDQLDQYMMIELAMLVYPTSKGLSVNHEPSSLGFTLKYGPRDMRKHSDLAK